MRRRRDTPQLSSSRHRVIPRHGVAVRRKVNSSPSVETGDILREEERDDNRTTMYGVGPGRPWWERSDRDMKIASVRLFVSLNALSNTLPSLNSLDTFN